MKEEVWIVGVGMTPFGRHTETSIKQLVSWAVSDALQDARVTADQVDAAYFGNCGMGALQGQEMIRGNVCLMPLGIEGVPIINVEAACATASVAFHLAVKSVESGDKDVALAVGAEKLCIEDKQKAFAIFDAAWDVERASQNRIQLMQMGAGITPPEGSTSTRPYSQFLDVYAAFCRFHEHRYGMTQRQLAAIASKNHQHSVNNERAQYRKPFTIEEILASPPVTWPLTLPMCSPLTDGAAAAIVVNAEGLARLGLDESRAVKVRATVLRSGTARPHDKLELHITRLAAIEAYEQAGIGPQDVDVAEVHDATAMGEAIQSENLGFCARGDGGLFAESGATALGGSIPINPSGGLESKGHPIGATGLGQIFELVQQLRGECGPRQVNGARFAIQENGGGLWEFEEAVAHLAVLEK